MASIKISINGKSKYAQISKSKIMFGINSGHPFKQQYIFIDLDDSDEEQSCEIAESLIKEQNLRRAIIIKSTNKHNGHHILSFSPKPFKEMLKIILEYGTDEKHFAKTQDNGFATLRLNKKSKSDITPTFIKAINNITDNPSIKLNFYDFDMEKAYLKMLEQENAGRN